MAVGYGFISTLIVLCAFAFPSIWALTATELAAFKTTGDTEQNTKLKGTVSVTTTNAYHTITSNGIPDHATGTFPAQSNPNSIQQQTHEFRVPENPTALSEPACLPMGPVGVATNGIPIFNLYNAQGHNAVEGEHREVFDSCQGHPDERGTYHYHQDPTCLYTNMRNEKFLGVAYDGFPIYGPLDANGKTITNKDLDKCHGMTVNGKYRYIANSEFPYIMGCFKAKFQGRSPPGGKCFFAYNHSPATRGQFSMLLSALLIWLTLSVY